MPTVLRPTSQQLAELARLSPGERRVLFKNPYSFLLFFSYYFHEYIKAPFADFHLEFAEDIGDLVTGRIHELAWFTFRESSKTSFAIAFLVQAIASRWFHYPNVDAYEGDNSERFLFDVVTTLQTNDRLRHDYGELFNAPTDKQTKTQKRVKDFLTTNDVRVEAHTTQEPVRGRKHREYRPDLIILDDFENLSTIRSEAATKSVKEHISEFKGGIDQKDGRILFLGNRLSDIGNVQSIIDRAHSDSFLRVRQVWLLNEDGRPSWPERHVLTDDDLRLHPDKISIETIRRSMNTPDTGDADFEREMMGNPTDPFGNGPDKQGYLPLFPDFSPNVSLFAVNPPHVIGVDPGGDGDDETVITVRSQFQAFIHTQEKRSTAKSVASHVLQAMREYEVPAESVVIDAFGVGYKTVQELALLGHNVKAVNVGESSEDCEPEKYFNDRAYMYFQAKTWLATGGALDNNPIWQKEARTIRFRTDEKGRRHIMPKKELIKRGHKSPNAMDSLALSFLVPLTPDDLSVTTIRGRVDYKGRWKNRASNNLNTSP